MIRSLIRFWREWEQYKYDQIDLMFVLPPTLNEEDSKMKTGPMTPEELVSERGKTHGDFSDHADCTQNLKIICGVYRNWQAMSNIQREALDMILHKIGRIMAGDPNHKDHWDDIAGYATLVSQRLKPDA